MTMQNNIDIIGRDFRRNMHQPEFQTSARKIDNQRPVLIPIAIASHNRERRNNCFEVERDCRLANIAQVPDLVRTARKIDNLLRQFVVRIGQNKNFHAADAGCFPQSAP